MNKYKLAIVLMSIYMLVLNLWIYSYTLRVDDDYIILEIKKLSIDYLKNRIHGNQQFIEYANQNAPYFREELDARNMEIGLVEISDSIVYIYDRGPDGINNGGDKFIDSNSFPIFNIFSFLNRDYVLVKIDVQDLDSYSVIDVTEEWNRRDSLKAYDMFNTDDRVILDSTKF